MNVRRMMDEGKTLDAMEVELRRVVVWEALRREKNHVGRAASRLGMHRNSLTRILAECQLPPKPKRRLIFRQMRKVAA